jgi:hypothetical protein
VIQSSYREIQAAQYRNFRGKDGKMGILGYSFFHDKHDLGISRGKRGLLFFSAHSRVYSAAGSRYTARQCLLPVSRLVLFFFGLASSLAAMPSVMESSLG